MWEYVICIIGLGGMDRDHVENEAAIHGGFQL